MLEEPQGLGKISKKNTLLRLEEKVRMIVCHGQRCGSHAFVYLTCCETYGTHGMDEMGSSENARCMLGITSGAVLLKG